MFASGNFLITGSSNIQGDSLYTTPGTYTWVCPRGVTKVSVVCVGAGGTGAVQDNAAGSGGGLGWKNLIPVIPGNSYTVVVGFTSYPGTGDSYFIDSSIVKGGGGQSTGSIGGTYVGDGGGNGGSASVGAGGAAGYSGNGGNGVTGYSQTPGSGSGGGGAGSDMWEWGHNGWYEGSGGGGGVGLYGQGASGIGVDGQGTGGQGGSGGQDGQNETQGDVGGNGGNYGAGGGRGGWYSRVAGVGASGAVRIVWSSRVGRLFPSTNVGKLKGDYGS